MASLILAFTLIKFKVLISPLFPELEGLRVRHPVTLHSHLPASVGLEGQAPEDREEAVEQSQANIK